MEFMLNLNALSDWGVLALRLAIGVIFLFHGVQKWAMWKMAPSEQMPAGMLNLMKLLSIVEPLGGLAILAGFLTQLVSLGLGIIMVGAINTKIRMLKTPFAAQDKTGWEFDFMILAGCIVLLFSGSGSISLDQLWFGN